MESTNSIQYTPGSEYGEVWENLEDESIINRIKLCVEDTNELNRFEAYDFYVPQDSNPKRYIIRIYAGRNGLPCWESYLEDMIKIFKSLTDPSKGNFKDVYLVEWRNNCANDTSAVLIAVKDN